MESCFIDAINGPDRIDQPNLSELSWKLSETSGKLLLRNLALGPLDKAD